MQEVIERAKQGLPSNKCVDVRIHIEHGFAYVFVKWPETGEVYNIDMDQRLTIEAQLGLAVEIANAAPPSKRWGKNQPALPNSGCKCTSYEIEQGHNGHCKERIKP